MQQKGQNLVEFLIIISLVVIAVIFALTLLGGNIFTLFTKVSDANPFNQTGDITDNTPLDGNTDVNPPDIAAGSLGGTPDNPVLQCANGKCNLDFGDYILNGIPENFGELVQSTGSSGGTDALMSFLEQIADQLDKKGDTAGAKEFRDLANVGHLMADIETKNEEALKNCISTEPGNVNACFKGALNQSNNITLPANLTSILPNFDPNKALYQSSKDVEITEAKSRISNPGWWVMNPPPDPTSTPSVAFVKLFDKIMANPNYSTQLKGTTQELYLSMVDIGYSHKVSALDGYYMNLDVTLNGDMIATWFDPLTGMTTGPGNTGVSRNLSALGSARDNLLGPKISSGTDLKSSLICSLGWNTDMGSSCHK